MIYDVQNYLDMQIKFFKDLRAFIISEIKDGKSVDEINLPQLEPIEQAYVDVENRQQKSTARRLLKNDLETLTLSFYSYYS